MRINLNALKISRTIHEMTHRQISVISGFHYHSTGLPILRSRLKFRSFFHRLAGPFDMACLLPHSIGSKKVGYILNEGKPKVRSRAAQIEIAVFIICVRWIGDRGQMQPLLTSLHSILRRFLPPSPHRSFPEGIRGNERLRTML